MRSRAGFKLEQLCKSEGLIREGDCVLDLGAAPGGWAQVAATLVGVEGVVVAVDLLKIEPIVGATIIEGDCCSDATVRAVELVLGGRPVDLVISDMSPNITGIAIRDEALHEQLVEMSLTYVDSHLRPGGTLIIKLFQYGDTERLVGNIRERFGNVARRKPDASRSDSREFYVVAKNFGI